MFHDEGMAPPALAPGMLASRRRKGAADRRRARGDRKEPSLVQVADVRTQLGDWYQMRRPARPRVAEIPAGVADRRARSPTKLPARSSRNCCSASRRCCTSCARRAGTATRDANPAKWNSGRSAANLTVDEQGRPQAIKITDDSGDAKRAEKTLQSIRTARYRPRFADGRPVATTDVAFSQPWTVPLEPEPRGTGDAGTRTKAEERLVRRNRVAGFLGACHPAAAGHARSPVRGTPRRASPRHRASRAVSPPAMLHHPCLGTTRPPAVP